MTSDQRRFTCEDVKAQAGKVAVLYGGRSAERDISLQSGTAVHAALLRQGIDAIAIDWREDIIGELRRQPFDRAFIALHGRGGEDGTIQALLDLLGIPYTGSGMTASALAMDKVRTKLLWQSLAVPTPPFLLLQRHQEVNEILQAIGLPLMVKPAHEGSSVGISRVLTAEQLPAALKLAARHDSAVFVERYIEGREYSIPILDGKALPMIGIETDHAFYDYDAKYLSNRTRYRCPSRVKAKLEASIAETALLAFDAVGARGWGRVDLMLDEQNQPWFIELNTVPGMTDHSLVPMSARAAGIDFDELVLRILGTSFG
ncbi:MAG: D-alanine--D-alanine ligase [Gammaproteobacteria bacterium]|nr:D-alanine--D-alanine ligase [Gammaproteobacteria bacterium]